MAGKPEEATMTPPRDHPLWPKFREWCIATMVSPENTMFAVYWDAFLAGARAGGWPPKPPGEKPSVLVVNEIKTDQFNM